MSEPEVRPQVLLVNRSIILNKDGNILLIQRAAEDTYGANMWEFPGGKLDAGQDVSDALEREVMEETGLLVMPVNRVAYYESRILPSGKYAGLPYIVLIGISKVSAGKIKLSAEHQDCAWVSVKQALKYDISDETRKALLALGKLLAHKL